MTENEVLQRIDADYVNSWSVIDGCADGGELVERDGVFVASSGVAVAWINLAIVTRPLEDPAKGVAFAIDFFDQRKLPFVVRIREGVDPATERACADLGLPYSDTVPSLLMSPIREAPPAPDDLSIRTCTSEADIADFQTVAGPCFGFSGDEVTRLFTPRSLAAAKSEFYVGYHDGAPVACGALIVTDGLAGVQIIGCVPEARRKGYGEAMTWQAVRRGHELRCDIAGLQASEMGRPIYERMGFEYATGYRTFVRPGS